ncbi:zebrafish testis-expressed 38 isoform X1 [Gadus chalcogrammus]|uniref:zebrafish testis-expressed 38 isoform X1 n=1 Tax=Gadus chalcogrammus TaxID=1042646 RepID=UPI0024C4B42E|nr:zebrafish testis-expressed 38 isoform X1 [Gadus chalcogrammus]
MAAGPMCMRKKKGETMEWTGLFDNELRTEQQSLVYVKRMMAVAVSSITYLRGIFPEDAYRSRYLEDLCIKVLRQDCRTPGASKVVKWMMGCFDALEKRYLQMVFIGVHTNPDKRNCIIESYQFKFKYTDKGPQMDVLRNQNVEMQMTLNDTKNASVLLVRKLFLLMQNLEALPSDINLSMKLYYYDDLTPADYQPPGFQEGVCDNLWFEGSAVHFRVGGVQTAHHALSLRVAAEQSRVEKLQEGNHIRDSRPSTGEPPRPLLPRLGGSQVTPDLDGGQDFPSEDESAQFKKPQRPLSKGKGSVRSLAKKRRM